MTTTSTAVEVRSLVKAFDGGAVRAVDDVSFVAPAGAITSIVGPSGCGKTTLLRCIAGLEQPSAGTVHIGEHDVTDLEPRDRGIGMVFQNAGLYPDKTVAGNIAFPLRMARVPRRERTERVREVADLVQLGELLHRYPKELSGGQRQRVGIARALVRRPRVVLMDEPLSSLDAALRTQLRRDLRALQRRLGITIIFVTHDQDEAMTLGDRLVVLFDGRLAQAGAPLEVFDRPCRADVAGFLGAMNLLPVPVLRDALAPGSRLDTTAATIGFRPEDAEWVPPGALVDGVVVRGRPGDGEIHGREALVAVRIGEVGNRGDDTSGDVHVQVLAARMQDMLDRPAVEIAVSTHALHLFDADGTRRRADLGTRSEVGVA